MRVSVVRHRLAAGAAIIVADGGAALLRQPGTVARHATVGIGAVRIDTDAEAEIVVGAAELKTLIVALRKGGSGRQSQERQRSERNGATYRPLGFAGDNRNVYMAKGVDGKPESIVLLDTETRQETPLSSNGTVSPSAYVWSSDRKTLLGVMYEDGIPYWDWIARDHPETLAYAGLVKAFPDKAVYFLRPSDDGRYLAMRVYADRLHRLAEQRAFDFTERREEVDHREEVVITALRYLDGAADNFLPRLGKFISH